MSILRTIIALARLSTLPTVWSNCLAGWWLGGGGHAEHLPFIFIGATLFGLGGAFLKDVFDVDYDRQHRPERPIPSGVVAESTVYRVGLALLTIGALLLLWPGNLTGVFGLCLVVTIIAHNTLQRVLVLAPVLRGISRLLFYLLGASVASRGIGGWVIWCGLALLLYTAGLGFLSQRDAKPNRSWPALLMIAPIVLALIMDAGEFRESGLLLSAILALWGLRCLRYLFWSVEPDRLKATAGLTAAIVFVDWLATCP